MAFNPKMSNMHSLKMRPNHDDINFIKEVASEMSSNQTIVRTPMLTRDRVAYCLWKLERQAYIPPGQAESLWKSILNPPDSHWEGVKEYWFSKADLFLSFLPTYPEEFQESSNEK